MSVADQKGAASSRADSTLWRFFRQKGAVVGASVLLICVVLAIVGPWVTPQDPLSMNFDKLLAGPSWSHPLGTDESGRDVLSRLVAGARVDVLAAMMVTLLASAIGVPLGLLVGFAGQRVNLIVMRIVESVQALPGIVILSGVIAVVGRGVRGAVIALGLALSLLVLFTTRSEVRIAREELYTASARVLGVPPSRIVLRHILPNVLPAILTAATTVFGIAFIGLAGLSFLGLGPQPPNPSWGNMLQFATTNMGRSMFSVFPPGTAILIVGVAAGAVSEGLRVAIRRGPSEHVTGVDLGVRLPDRPPLLPNTDGPNSRSSQAEPVLQVRNLTVSAKGHPGDGTIVRNVDLELMPRQILGLVGESGSGKTMTASAIAGLLPAGVSAAAETLMLDGIDLRTLSHADLRKTIGTRLGMVFQNPQGSLNPTRRIGSQLVEAAVTHGHLSRTAATARSLELLRAVGINDPRRVADSRAFELSGGMAQRVMIASALMCEPRVLLADEPTTALDVTVQAQVIDLLHQVRDEFGTAILFITHDLAVVADLCDEVAVMQSGEIVERGTALDVFQRPQHSYTQLLLSCAPTADRQITQVTT
jgi:peptide/nickel transport system permease protein